MFVKIKEFFLVFFGTVRLHLKKIFHYSVVIFFDAFIEEYAFSRLKVQFVVKPVLYNFHEKSFHKRVLSSAVHLFSVLKNTILVFLGIVHHFLPISRLGVSIQPSVSFQIEL